MLKESAKRRMVTMMKSKRSELVESASCCVNDMQRSLARSAADLADKIRDAEGNLKRLRKEYRETVALPVIISKCSADVKAI